MRGLEKTEKEKCLLLQHEVGQEKWGRSGEFWGFIDKEGRVCECKT
jgi:hypothetical protein